MVPAYIKIAQHLEQQIRTGQLRPGEKLESIRQMALTEGVSVNTIRSSIDVLAQTGLIRVQARKAPVVLGLNSKPDFKPYEQFSPDEKLASQSREWLDTAVSPNRACGLFMNMVVPTDNPLFKTFQHHYRQSLLLAPKSAVENSAGNQLLRDKLAKMAAKRHHFVDANAVQITNGCQNAIEHALRVTCQPGDTVVLPTPAFPGYLALLSLLQLKLIEVPMTPFGPDPLALEEVLASGKAKVLIVNPICHNPTGVSLTDEYKRQIAKWANEYQIAIIEDDICSSLHFCETQPRPIASFDKNGWVLLVSSVSKLMGDSERLGWCFPGRFKDAYMTQFAVSQIASPFFRQKALTLYLNGTRFNAQLSRRRQEICSAVNQAKQSLVSELEDNIKITQPSGGYSLWIKLPAQIDAKCLRVQANAENIDFLPGEFFSLNSRFKNYLRLVIMPPLTDQHQLGLIALAKLIRQHL